MSSNLPTSTGADGESATGSPEEVVDPAPRMAPSTAPVAAPVTAAVAPVTATVASLTARRVRLSSPMGFSREWGVVTPTPER